MTDALRPALLVVLLAFAIAGSAAPGLTRIGPDLPRVGLGGDLCPGGGLLSCALKRG